MFNPTLLDRIDRLKARLDRIRPLPPEGSPPLITISGGDPDMFIDGYTGIDRGHEAFYVFCDY